MPAQCEFVLYISGSFAEREAIAVYLCSESASGLEFEHVRVPPLHELTEHPLSVVAEDYGRWLWIYWHSSGRDISTQWCELVSREHPDLLLDLHFLDRNDGCHGRRCWQSGVLHESSSLIVEDAEEHYALVHEFYELAEPPDLDEWHSW